MRFRRLLKVLQKSLLLGYQKQNAHLKEATQNYKSNTTSVQQGVPYHNSTLQMYDKQALLSYSFN